MTLETSSRYKECKIAYIMHSGSGGNLVPLSIFTILFPNTTVDQLNWTKDSRVVMKIYEQSEDMEIFGTSRKWLSFIRSARH